MKKVTLLVFILLVISYSCANVFDGQKVAGSKQSIEAQLLEVDQVLQFIDEVLRLAPRGAGEVVISREVLKFFPITYVATFLKKYPKIRIAGVILPVGYVIKITLDKSIYHILVLAKAEFESKKRQLEWSLKTLPKNS